MLISRGRSRHMADRLTLTACARSKVRTARGASAARKAKIQAMDAAALEVRVLLEETMQLCRR